MAHLVDYHKINADRWQILIDHKPRLEMATREAAVLAIQQMVKSGDYYTPRHLTLSMYREKLREETPRRWCHECDELCEVSKRTDTCWYLFCPNCGQSYEMDILS